MDLEALLSRAELTLNALCWPQGWPRRFYPPKRHVAWARSASDGPGRSVRARRTTHGQERRRAGSFCKPRRGERIGLEELEHEAGHFLAAGARGVRAVAGQILALIVQAIGLARCQAVGPQIWPPEQDGRVHFAAGRSPIRRRKAPGLARRVRIHHRCGSIDMPLVDWETWLSHSE